MTCNNNIWLEEVRESEQTHLNLSYLDNFSYFAFYAKGEDFHLDRELYLACRKDREAVCSEVRLSYVVVVQQEYLIENYECASLLLR